MSRLRYGLLPLALLGGWWIARPAPGASVGREVASDGRAAGEFDLPSESAEEGSGPLRAEVARLRLALAAEREAREVRENEWLEFTRAMASLRVDGAPAAPGFLDLGEEESAPPGPDRPGEDPVPDPRLRRSREILRDLRALLFGEQVMGLDVLEVGIPGEGAAGERFTGPVVVRLLDALGRPAGTLACERLRLECSRSARSVTLVFEQGYERYGDAVLAFGPLPNASHATGATEEPLPRVGLRRIDLAHVDPEPWIELLPELFRAEDLAPVADDGRWQRVLVMEELNRLLGETRRGGRWRLRELGGVHGDTLRAVHLEQLGEGERVTQRIFADRLRIQAEGGGVLLVLEDGVSERNGKRAAFLDGRFRIFLPAAPLAEWRAAQLPHALGAAAKREQG